jgi:UDP-N-acetylmuramyl pentapeptide phosphotransferase/UDP-N-acetylglucosamine-1-phosphate transferase
MLDSYLAFLATPEYRTPAIFMLLVAVCRLVVFPLLWTYLLVAGTIYLSHQYEIVARPSSRGSHLLPTPRLGGLGGAGAFYVTMAILAHWQIHMPLEAWSLTLLVGGMWALIGGGLDDCQELTPRWKLLVQIAACGTVVAFGFAPTQFQLPLAGVIHLSSVTGSIIAVLMTFFLMNIFNFMDGMDGHAAVFGIVTALALGLYRANYGFQMGGGSGLDWFHTSEATCAVVLAATLGGLLIYNHPGRVQNLKTFMGDCGSQFYGFTLAVIALQAGQGQAVAGQFPWMASVILFSPFIYDVVYTLIRRYRRGERLSQAHRSHLYQRLMVAGWTHGKTLAFNLGMWIAIASLSWFYAKGADDGHVWVQFFSLGATALVLAGYTMAVIDVENRSDERRSEEKRQSEILAREAHYPGSPGTAPVTEYLSQE